MSARKNLKTLLVMSVILAGMGCTIAAAGTIRYVDADAGGNNNGSSWTDAYIYLQDAMKDANSVPGDEIWVAEGTYKPDSNTADPNSGARGATFQLISGVAIYGGFAGGESTLGERDWQTNQTILSGDINTPADNNDNSYHVVTASGTDATAVIDGFTITAGNANGSFPDEWGGGMVSNPPGSPTVTNCTFSGNSATWGGGMYNVSNSSPTVTNCIFSGNSAALGGGMLHQVNSPILTNCTFSGNLAGIRGGGMYNNASSPTLTNCILWGDTAASDGNEIALVNSSTIDVNYCDVKDGNDGIFNGSSTVNWGVGNIDADPLFVDADGPDDIVGTEDDDVRLLVGSPCIDAGQPGPQYQDADGTRNDMGAYGGLFGGLGGVGSRDEAGFIFTTIGNIPTVEIIQSDPCEDRIGLVDVNSTEASEFGIPIYQDCAFGSTLWLHGLFGANDNVDYYQILVGRWDDGNAPGSEDYVALSTSLTKVRWFIDPCGVWTYERVTLGPQTIDGNDGVPIENLYKLTDEGYWSHIDLRARWNTTVYEDGKYTLTYNAYQWDDPCDPCALVVVDLPATDGFDEPNIIIDNNPPTAVIHNVKYDPCNPNYDDPCDGEIPECAIIGLVDPCENLRFTITASHPTGYLRAWSLSSTYGKNKSGGTIDSNSYDPAAMGLYWDGLTDVEVESGNSIAWQECAYQFRLSASSRITNGYSHIYGASFSDHYYLDRGIAYCGGADIDHSGNVDFKDLARLAARWLDNCQP